jgi:uncharacterized RDD family membrane protein YckC
LPIGIALTTPGRRFGACLLDAVLAIVTLFVGWLVWSIVVWGRGQSPGKQLLGVRCVKIRENRCATWGTMVLREFVYKGILFGIVASVTFGIGIVLYLWLLWDKRNQELWDKMAGTIVVDDSHGLTRSHAVAVSPARAQQDATSPVSETRPTAPTRIGHAAAPAIVVAEPSGTVHRLVLAGETIIGREGTDVVVDDEQVSRRHLRLAPTGDGVLLEDLGSSNGTWVNGRRIDSPVVVAEGDRVAIGESTIAVEDFDPAATVVRDA